MKLTKTKLQLTKLLCIIELIEKAQARTNDAKALLYSYDNAKDDFATIRLFRKRSDLVAEIERYFYIVNRLNSYYKNQLNNL
jgi:hypothetical protein